jgi:hypothetical protein
MNGNITVDLDELRRDIKELEIEIDLVPLVQSLADEENGLNSTQQKLSALDVAYDDVSSEDGNADGEQHTDNELDQSQEEENHYEPLPEEFDEDFSEFHVADSSGIYDRMIPLSEEYPRPLVEGNETENKLEDNAIEEVLSVSRQNLIPARIPPLSNGIAFYLLAESELMFVLSRRKNHTD